MSSSNRPLVLCATRWELAQLKRNSDLMQLAEVACTGPGVSAVLDWLIAHVESAKVGITGRIIIMAGVAGALHPQFEPGQAFLAKRVSTMDGERWTPTWPVSRPGGLASAMSVHIVTGDQVLRDSPARQSVRDTVGADLVDMESAGLAAWATKSRSPILWGAVRGVSDGFDDALPPGIERWLRDDGGVNGKQLALDLAARPWSVPRLMRLRRQSESAMRSVITLLKTALGRSDPTAETPGASPAVPSDDRTTISRGT